MTKEKLEKMQDEISAKMLDVISGNLAPALKQVRLEQLNLKLDSLNRAAYYLMRNEK